MSVSAVEFVAHAAGELACGVVPRVWCSAWGRRVNCTAARSQRTQQELGSTWLLAKLLPDEERPPLVATSLRQRYAFTRPAGGCVATC